MRKLFIISDLHLGGRPVDSKSELPSFQFNHSYSALIEFIDWVREESRNTSTSVKSELVINGDIVDFLAEDDYGATPGASIWTGDESEAIARLVGIAERTRNANGRCVFTALKDLVSDGVALTLLIGNHDVELSLPHVREHFLAMLGGASKSIKFIYDGEAYVTGRVLIEHGNRYDRWNMVDHSSLRQERSMLSRNLPIDESRRSTDYFVPPAGTHLVIHVINRIKSRYRFIDLVKPETNVVIPLLLALEPGLATHIARVLQNLVILKQLQKNKLRTPATPYNKDALAADLRGEPVLDEVLAQVLGDDVALFDQNAARSGDVFLGLDESWSEKWHQLAEQATSLSAMLKINFAGLADDRRRQLHAALRALKELDESYSIDREDPTYLNAATETALHGDFDAIIYGHTHLPKQIAIRSKTGDAWYVNTGTWCDVIRLPPGLAASYDDAHADLTHFLEALRLNAFDPYVKRYLSYAELSIDVERGGRLQELNLRSFCGAGRERSEPLTSYPVVPQ